MGGLGKSVYRRRKTRKARQKEKAEKKAQDPEEYILYRAYHPGDHGSPVGKKYDQRAEQSGSDGSGQPESAGNNGK